MIQLRIEINNAPTNAAVKVTTENPLIMPDPRNQKITPLMIREKRPRVRILRGNVRILMIGLKNMLTKHRHAPTIRATHIGETVTPDTMNVVAQTAADRTIQCKMIRIINEKILLK
jgi:hypothetical protein